MRVNFIRRYTEAQEERCRELIQSIDMLKREYTIRCQPYLDELSRIDACTPASYILMDDDLNIIGITREQLDQ